MWARIPAQIPSRKKKLVFRSVSPAWIFQLARQPANSSSTAPPELSESPGAATGGHATHSMVNSRDLTAQQILQAGTLSPNPPISPTMVAKLVSHRCPSCEAHIEAMEKLFFLTFFWRSCYNIYRDSNILTSRFSVFPKLLGAYAFVKSIKYQDHCGFSVSLGTCVGICANVLIRGTRNVGGAQEATAQGIHGDQ